MDVPGIDPARIRLVLLDIEGTTTPTEFVDETLFPYARANLETYLVENYGETQIRDAITDLREQREVDVRSGKALPPWIADTSASEVVSAARYGLWLMDHDSKASPLKILQGLIWRSGYESGRLKGQVYLDVPVAFDRWRAQGKEIATYSSGSELAQKLLFSTTQFGDLTRHISRFFDTRMGAKQDVESYRRIARALNVRDDRFLFLSDVPEELNAARCAGMQTALVARTRIGDALSGEHAVIHSFDPLS